jgi:hypothetical protein
MSILERFDMGWRFGNHYLQYTNYDKQVMRALYSSVLFSRKMEKFTMEFIFHCTLRLLWLSLQCRVQQRLLTLGHDNRKFYDKMGDLIVQIVQP